jgi:hypothetical protein
MEFIEVNNQTMTQTVFTISVATLELATKAKACKGAGQE